MTCDKCESIHEAQREGKTQEPCKCDCHPVHICPISPYPEYSWWTDPTSPTTPYPQWGFNGPVTTSGNICCQCTNPNVNHDNLTNYYCPCKCHGCC